MGPSKYMIQLDVVSRRVSIFNGYKGIGFLGKRVSSEPKEETRRLSQKPRCGLHHMSIWGISTIVLFILWEAMPAAGRRSSQEHTCS